MLGDWVFVFQFFPNELMQFIAIFHKETIKCFDFRSSRYNNEQDPIFQLSNYGENSSWIRSFNRIHSHIYWYVLSRLIIPWFFIWWIRFKCSLKLDLLKVETTKSVKIHSYKIDFWRKTYSLCLLYVERRKIKVGTCFFSMLFFDFVNVKKRKSPVRIFCNLVNVMKLNCL